MFDGICSPFDTDKCNYNLANKKFLMGTATHPDSIATALVNERISSPASEKYGEEIYVFPAWGLVTYGPAAGLVYYPCAAEQVCIICISLCLCVGCSVLMLFLTHNP